MAKLALFSFNSGEIAPELHHRSDLQKYRSSLQRCENFLVLPQGGLKRRLGTEVLAKIDDSSGFDTARLWIWEVDRENYFIMVFIDDELRFYTPSGVLVETITSIPWATTDFAELYFKQVYDVMFICHSSFPVKRLSRTNTFTWAISDHEFQGGPYGEINTDTSNIMTFTTGSPNTLTTVSDAFTADDVGRKVKLINTETLTLGGSYSATGTTTSSNLPAHGEVLFKTEGGTWAGEVFLELSTDGGTSWEVIASVRSESNTNKELSRDIEEFNALVRVRFERTSGTMKWTLEAENQTYSHFTIDSYNSSTSVNVSTDALEPATGYNSFIWALGAFCETNGYPACVEVFEERLMFAGVPNSPATVYGSRTNDFSNWQTGLLSTSPIQFTLANDVRNRIRWMIPETQLVLGTDYGEWTIGTRDSNSALAGDNVNTQRHTQFGTEPIQPVLSGDTSLYIEAGGKRMRAAEYSYERDGYVSNNMSVLARHITEDYSFQRMAYTRSPDQIIWALRSDGELYSFTHEREHQVSAWSHHPMSDNSDIIDIGSVLQTDGDEIPMIVKRSDGVYLEIMRQGNFYFDWQSSYDGVSAFDVISLIGNESYQFYGEDLNEMPTPYEGQGVYVWVDYVGAGVSELVIKYDGIQIALGVDFIEATKEGNYLYWLPEKTDDSLVTVFDGVTALNASDYEAYNSNKCYVVDIVPEYDMSLIDILVSSVSVDAKYLYRMEGKQQVLVLNQESTLVNDITVEYNTTEIDQDEYITYRPELSFSTYGTSNSIVYAGVKMESLLKPVDIFNFPDGGGAGTSNRINEVELFLVDSIGGEISTNDGDNWEKIPYIKKDQILGEQLTQETGKFSVKSLRGSFDFSALQVRTDSPYNMKLAAIGVIGQRMKEK